MKTLKQLCNNDPLVAIKATIDGLLTQERFDWLKLDMTVYAMTGERPDGTKICCGCAASFAVLQLNFPVTVPSISTDLFVNNRPRLLGLAYDDLETFERAIDNLRQGYAESLFDYFGVPFDGDPYFDVEHPFLLSNHQWESELHLLIYYYEQLAKTPFVPPKTYQRGDWQFGVFKRLAAFKQSLIPLAADRTASTATFGKIT